MKKLLLATILLMICFSSFAQDDAYKAFLQQRNQEFKDWRAKANAEFTDYLAKAWEEFLVQTGRKDPIGEVPEKPTYFGNQPSSPTPHGYPSEGAFSSPIKPMKMALTANYLPEDNCVNIDFFGVQTAIPFDKGMFLPFLVAKEKEVSVAWNKMSQSQYMPTVDALSALKTQYSLSDWAIYSLIKQFTEAIYKEENINEKVATQMFLLCQLKYKVRVGSAGDDLVLLLPFKEQIYQVSYISDSNMDFYIFGYTRLGSQTPLYSFTQDFSVAKDPISLTIKQSMKLGGADDYQIVKMPLWSTLFGEEVTIPVNRPYISFALNYPQADLPIYHHSAVDSETSKAILNKVRLHIMKSRMDERQSVAFILNLIQNGFEYKTDYEMFGRPKPLFVEESIFYGSNNCKDRVLLFSWMVKNILKLNTVMLGYPNHVACGVEFRSDVEGDSFSHNNHKYVMCDPTYINAPIGATMPKFKNTAPVIVEL